MMGHTRVEQGLAVRVPLQTILCIALTALSVATCDRLSNDGPAATDSRPYDLIIRGGLVYDGDGGQPIAADVGVRGDTIARIGDLSGAAATREIDARGLAVAPGFINMLSWATDSLMQDGHAQSDVRQGVTLEVMGEGESMGPLNEDLKRYAVEQQIDIHYDITWSTLGEWLQQLERKGISTNVASFVGATTVRENVIGFDDRAPTSQELERMQELVRTAMKEGALGVGSSLIYAPAFYAHTDELIALCRAAAEYDGMYISHIRSEGDRLLEAVDELIEIARSAGIRAEIYHLKAAGKSNWGKMDQVFQRVEAARAAGLAVSANMYTYTAGATGLNASMPPWVQEGGLDAWVDRMRDPAIRERVVREMRAPGDQWENLLVAAGADGVLLNEFKNPALKPLTGRTLAAVAAERGQSPEETAIDLVIEDGSRVGAIYFLMSEDNVEKAIARPWVSFGSDEGAPAPEGVFLQRQPHPRAYGNVARLLGHYVRDRRVIPLEEAVRRLTSLPAGNLHIERHGRLQPDYYADIVVFDPAKVEDHATYEQPHQYATGVVDVFVNGVQVIADGEHTGATPGRFVRGPGWRRVPEGAPISSPSAVRRQFLSP
jgi:N-acyl-D-amino-acid deacylase